MLANGHVVSRARYLVKNGEQQFLRISLAEGTSVLSVAVDGRGVKARRDDKGAIAISLPSARTLVVELRYEVVVDKLGVFGSLDVQAPKLDIRQSALHWVLRAPGDQTVSLLVVWRVSGASGDGMLSLTPKPPPRWATAASTQPATSVATSLTVQR